MPRRRKPAGLECLVELARKAAILEQEMSAQREAIERLLESAKPASDTQRPRRLHDRGTVAAPAPPPTRWCPNT
jgi:hypothetical protein